MKPKVVMARVVVSTCSGMAPTSWAIAIGLLKVISKLGPAGLEGNGKVARRVEHDMPVQAVES